MKAILVILLSLCHFTLYSQIVRCDKHNDSNGYERYGYKDNKGKWVIKDLATAHWNTKMKIGTFSKFINNKLLYSAIDEYGKVIIPYFKCTFDDGAGIKVTDFYGKEGFYSYKGNIIFSCEYEKVWSSYEGFVYAYNSNSTVLYNIKSQKYVNFSAQYDFIDDKENFYRVQQGKFYGLTTKDGTEISSCNYTSLYIDGQYIRVSDSNGNQGILTTNNEIIVPIRFPYVSMWKQYKIIFVKNYSGKMGAYDLSGKKVADCNYDTVINAKEDLYIVKQNNKWGYCADGKEVIACQYDEAGTFANGVATVKKDGEVKLIKNPLKNADEIQIAEGGGVNNKKTLGGPAVSRYPAPKSDVDKDIPTNKSNPNSTTFAFIISNENYPEAPVPYALNDGRMFKEYCQKTLALPENHIFVYEDATFGNIIAAVEKMKDISKAYDNEAKLIIYYAGHGVPDEKNNSAYLLPIDGNANSVSTTGYSLAKFYSQISEMKPKSAVVFIDACFSGAKREDQMLTSARGVAIKVKNDVPQGNLVVFSAAQGDETAHQNESKGHGLFTYYLLKKLQETSGNTTLGELSEYVIKQVKRQSVVINNKLQVPMVIPSQSMVNTWQSLGLK